MTSLKSQMSADQKALLFARGAARRSLAEQSAVKSQSSVARLSVSRTHAGGMAGVVQSVQSVCAHTAATPRTNVGATRIELYKATQ